MRLPDMKYADKITKSTQIKFGGLNKSVGANDGEMVDMMCLTSDHSPVLSTRPSRLLYKDLSYPCGLFSWNGLCWVDGVTFFYNGEAVGKVALGTKTLASLGPWIVIMPDKCCYNVETGEFKSMEAIWTGQSLTFTNGLRYGEEAAANAIVDTYTNWEDYFSVGDAVTIAGCTMHESNNITAVIREIDGGNMYFSENVFALNDDGTGYDEQGELTITRKVPDILYICEHENRLWGCTEDTIYASKPGDLFNWFVYDGLDSDAWALTPASAGSFTGVVSYRGYVTFFKENQIYKVYGSIPSNYEVLGSATLGLAQGSSRSLAIAGETLFYLSRNGIMAYTGGIPQPVGQAFGTERFRDAVAGSDGLKYYVTMADGEGIYRMYVYDTQVGQWNIEDLGAAEGFAWHNGNLYMLSAHGEIWIIGNIQNPPEACAPEPTFAWWAEFADFTEEDPNRKGVSKLQLRLELSEGADMCVHIQFDSDGVWHQVRHIVSEGSKRSYYLPIIPRRCDHYRLRLSGNGGCKVYSMVRESYSGSEL